MSGSTHDMVITVSVAISAGALLVTASRRLNLPAIVLLLAGGVLLGPAVLGESAPVQPDALGDGLAVIVALAVGIILFEGGLTLDLASYRTASTMIRRLLSFGVLVTWFGTALAISLVTAVDWRYAILAASLVIVTGPTVIAPLLKRLRVNERLHGILHWEGVLIDPIGVFFALMTYELVVANATAQGAVGNLLLRYAAGLGLGLLGGWAGALAVRRRIVPAEMTNVFALGLAVLVFGAAEAVASEAGLLSVTVAGFVFAALGASRVKGVRQFKGEITDLLIGTLFILLSARLEPQQFLAFGLEGVAVVAIVLLVVRPASILLCSAGLGMPANERAFLSWVAPRGIVAASMASLFALSMSKLGGEAAEDAVFVETFVYSVIVATIVLQGLSAGLLARWLGVERPEPKGWLFIGAHALALRAAEFVQAQGGHPVVVIDTNARAVREATSRGLRAYAADAREAASLVERFDLRDIGHVAALTDNEDLNVRLCQAWSSVVGEGRTYRCDRSRGRVHDSAGADAGEAEATNPGRPIWSELPRPSLVSSELQRGEASTTRATVDAAAPPERPADILLHATEDGTIGFGPPPEGRAADVLRLRRTADYLAWSLRPELVITSDATDVETLLTEAVDRIVSLVPRLPRDETIRELLERERSFPTVVGGGVAVPHAYSAALDARLCALVRIPGGVCFGGPAEPTPVRLAFVLLSPQGDPEGHLATLAEIARLVMDAEVREALVEAPTPIAVLRIINAAVR